MNEHHEKIFQVASIAVRLLSNSASCTLESKAQLRKEAVEEAMELVK